MKSRILNSTLGRLASQLSEMTVVRLWADQALTKEPYSPPTGFHLDAPLWPFTAADSISAWLALDDATLINGAMCYLPGVHRPPMNITVDLTAKIGGLFDKVPCEPIRSEIAGSIRRTRASLRTVEKSAAAGRGWATDDRCAGRSLLMDGPTEFNGHVPARFL